MKQNKLIPDKKHVCHNPCEACTKTGTLENGETCAVCGGSGCTDQKVCALSGGLGCKD